MKKGIDVSRWQGTINWKAAAKDPHCEFAIIKAGGSDAGFYTDPKFEENYRNAKAAGVPVGSYYFPGKDFKSKADGEADALRYLNIIAGKKFEYPVVVDVEAVYPYNKKGNTDATIAFCEVMENHGYYISIYSSDVSGFVERLELDRLKAYDKWVACYGRLPRFVKQFGMYQYSSTGKISGIIGNVDLDNAYYDFPQIMKTHHLNGY